jgi:hypothetical protein
MNFGRIILKNLMGSGYPKEQLCIIRPGETEIDGVRCVEGLKALDGKLDLLIVAVAASAVYDLVDEIIASDAVESVMLIPGSLGETRASREPAAALAERINAAHGKPGGGPIFLGANCLGVVSHPGNYDSWFIPLERLPKPPKKAERNSVMLSQSGAFMITRISQNPWLDPRYMLALGNQTDLTHGDMLSYFAELPEIETIGIYIEGFKDGDGLDFARAVRKAVALGKDVVVYKSGKTAPGMGGVMGHTASIAGGPVLFESVVRHAGAIVAEDFNAFDDLFYIAGACTARPSPASGWAPSAVPASRPWAWRIRSSPTASPWKWARWKPHVTRAGRHPQGQETRRPGRGEESDRHQPGRRRRGPPADRRGLPARPEHRRRGGRPRPHRALGARAGIEQAAPRLRHQRPEEHGAPDAAAGRAQRQADHRHRRWRQPLRRHVRPPDGSGRLHFPQLRARHAGRWCATSKPASMPTPSVGANRTETEHTKEETP